MAAPKSPTLSDILSQKNNTNTEVKDVDSFFNKLKRCSRVKCEKNQKECPHVHIENSASKFWTTQEVLVSRRNSSSKLVLYRWKDNYNKDIFQCFGTRYLDGTIASELDMEWQPGLHFSKNERLAEWIVGGICSCPYEYGRNMCYPPHYARDSPMISKLRQNVNLVTSLSTNSSNVEFYGNGEASIPEHSDFETKLRLSKNYEYDIASISIGTPRAFTVRRKNSDAFQNYNNIYKIIKIYS